ncbi:MAG TPA: AAA family ATPase [Fluviicoccus sp.]|nr:AAA family ATPase [Fluviicoccus sp.]
MSPSKRDFERFVVWLHDQGIRAPTDVRRMANLVLVNFDALEQTSRQRSQRSAYLVDRARKGLAQTPDGRPDIQAIAVDGAWPWKHLRSMTIGPFRGFRTPESFDLQKRVILFYGPNGSGKTSFCEGLEFALLGSVEEADNKRITPSIYLANHHARRFEAPILRANDHRNREIGVVANLDIFRFCFIEKNRIDAFSRIAARPPAQRTELIATLFGMEKFNEFVGHFNESLDQQLVLTGTKQLTLTSKRNALAVDRATVDGMETALKKLTAEEAELASTHTTGMNYEGLKEFIGTTEAPGRLKQLDDILANVPPAVIGLTRDGLIMAFEASELAHNETARIEAILEARRNQVSFKELYTAILSLQASHSTHCPACDTPLVDAVSDPFEKAKAGLNDLKELGELQEQLKAAQGTAATASRELRRQLGIVATFLTAAGEHKAPTARYILGLAAEPVGTWWRVVYQAHPVLEDAVTDTVTLETILAVVNRIEIQDKASQQAQQDRQPHVKERTALINLQLSIQAQDLKRRQIMDNLAAAKTRIAAFDLDNAQLIREVAQESLDIARDASIKAAYDRFLELLRSYRNQLPGTLMAGLNDTALTLYNEFNRNDLDVDKLAALHLPINGEQKIEIAFRGNPKVRVDALHILSEGHIRCLGLAILLAKALSIRSPLVVFDDAINAIDHDHRGGIRETIFESDHFVDTQLIVTCHSNEFIKDIQQHLPAQRRSDCQVYLFRHHTGDYQPRVKGDVSTKNYLAKARAAIDNLDNREALAACRQGLEMLSEKVWRWLGSHELGVLNLQLAGVGAEPGLRNLCDALRKRLDEATTFNHPNKLPLLKAYRRILGIPAANQWWTILNKGTHEEANRDEFDAELVESIVQTLEEIDSLDLRVGR